MTSHYDWNNTFTYVADEYVILARRNKGKTFGFRKYMVEQFIKKGLRWGALARTKASLIPIMNGYFEKLKADGFFKDYVFKTEAYAGYIAKKPKNDNDKPKWKQCCYFRALTDFQNIKNETFVNVGYVNLDEAVLDMRDRFHNYLPDEPGILASIVNSMAREDGNGGTIQPRLVLMGNTCDLCCPHIQHLGVRKKPPEGKSWWWNKTRLLDWVRDNEAKKMIDNTVSARLALGTSEEKSALYNDFDDMTGYLVGKKTQGAKYMYGIKFSGRTIGVWVDWQEGYIYITNKIVKNRKLYALTKDDGDVNTLMLKRSESVLKFLIDCYYTQNLRFETDELREFGLDMLTLFGLK